MQGGRLVSRSCVRHTCSKLTPAPYEKAQTSEEMIYIRHTCSHLPAACVGLRSCLLEPPRAILIRRCMHHHKSPYQYLYHRITVHIIRCSEEPSDALAHASVIALFSRATCVQFSN